MNDSTVDKIIGAALILIPINVFVTVAAFANLSEGPLMWAGILCGGSALVGGIILLFQCS